MDEIPLSEIERLPFVHAAPRDGRRVVLQSYFDADVSDWFLFLEVKPGLLGRIAGGEPVYGGYLSREVADPVRDVEFPLATLLTQHLSFPKIIGRLSGIENDFHQCAAIMEKYHLIWSQLPQSSVRSGLLIASELEYLFLVTRSLYDLVHNVVCEVASLLVVLDGTNRRAARQMPDSFRAVAMNGDELRSGDEIRAKYGLPAAIANWYVHEAPAFKELRRIRDGIAHHGRTVPTIFELPEGFALDVTSGVWEEFAIWPPNLRVGEKFGSVRALFAAAIGNAFDATTRLVTAIRSSVQLPASVGQDVHSFLRSPFGTRLVELPTILAAPWEGTWTPIDVPAA